MLCSTLFVNTLIGQINNWDRKGYTLPMFSYLFENATVRNSTLNEIMGTGANSIIFDFQLEMQGLNGSTVTWNTTLTPSTPHNPTDLMDMINKAKAINPSLYVIVKPIVMIRNGANLDTNWQQMAPNNVSNWFDTYWDRIEEVLQEPGAGQINAFILGNELNSMSVTHATEWNGLVDNIEAEDPSLAIGYNAGAFLGYTYNDVFVDKKEEYPHVVFMDRLDFFGFSSYPRLLKVQNNTGTTVDPTLADYEDYVCGWSDAQWDRDYKQEVIDFCQDYPGISIYFTELGSPSCDGGIYNFNGLCSNGHDLNQQKEFYDASFHVLNTITESNFKGVFVYDVLGGDDWDTQTSNGPSPYVWDIRTKPATKTLVTSVYNGTYGGGASTSCSGGNPGSGDWVEVAFEDFNASNTGSWDYSLTNSFRETAAVNACGGGSAVAMKGNGSVTLKNSVDLSDATEARITFIYRTHSLESTERFAVDYSSNGGSAWSEIQEFSPNGSCTPAEVVVNTNLTANAKFRFRGKSDGNDFIYIDDAKIEKKGSGGGNPGGACVFENFDGAKSNWLYSSNGWKGPASNSCGGGGSSAMRMVAPNGHNLTLKQAIDLSSAGSATVSFEYKTLAYLSGQVFWLEYSNNGGSTWTTHATYGNENCNGTKVTTINSNSSNFKIRFRTNNVSGGNRRVFIDNLELCPNGSSSNISNPDITSFQNQAETRSEIIEPFQFYPNPTTGILNVQYKGNYDVVIYDLLGKAVINVVGLSGRQQIDLSDLHKGAYYIEYNNGKERTTKMFIVE